MTPPPSIHNHQDSSRSRSIPIQQQHYQSRHNRRIHDTEQRIHEDELMADYIDYCFCERLVSGMQRKVSCQIHDVSLRYENQALIDHIINTRRAGSRRHRYDDDDEMSPPSSPPMSPTLRPRIITAPSFAVGGDSQSNQGQRSSGSSGSSSIEDEMIFDLEL